MTGNSSVTIGNARSVDAEIGALIQAGEIGVDGKSLTLLVDGKQICPFCLSGIPRIASALGVKQLTVADSVRNQVVRLSGPQLLGPNGRTLREIMTNQGG